MNFINKRIKISFLDMDEHFLRSAEGIATSGSINIDGASALRRTSQLAFSTQDISAVDYFELYKTKFKLEVDLGTGYKTQGIYLLTSFSSNLTANNFTFNISGKDKMCLLNGEHGGSFSSSVDFGKLDSVNEVYYPIEEELYEAGKYYKQIKTQDDEESSVYNLSYELDYGAYRDPNTTYFKKELQYIQTKIPIKDIIVNLLTEYGYEKRENIFIYDLDIVGLELLEYRGSTPLYLYRNKKTGKIEKMTIEGTDKVTTKSGEVKYISELGLGYYPLTPFGEEINLNNVTVIIDNEIEYYIIKIEYGQAIGYRDTDLVYAGDLLGNINENVVSILDKIKNMLGNYEYFYNENGYFIFRRRKDYINNEFFTINTDGLGMEYSLSSPFQYEIYKLKQSDIISIQNTPSIMNIKNDFSIWGNRQGINEQLPIHSRIAIHNIPDWYTNYNGIKFIYDKDSYDSLLNNQMTKEKNIKDINDLLTKNIENNFKGNFLSQFKKDINTIDYEKLSIDYEKLFKNYLPIEHTDEVNFFIKNLYTVLTIFYFIHTMVEDIYDQFYEEDGIFKYRDSSGNIRLSYGKDLCDLLNDFKINFFEVNNQINKNSFLHYLYGFDLSEEEKKNNTLFRSIVRYFKYRAEEKNLTLYFPQAIDEKNNIFSKYDNIFQVKMFEFIEYDNTNNEPKYQQTKFDIEEKILLNEKLFNHNIFNNNLNTPYYDEIQIIIREIEKIIRTNNPWYKLQGQELHFHQGDWFSKILSFLGLTFKRELQEITIISNKQLYSIPTVALDEPSTLIILNKPWYDENIASELKTAENKIQVEIQKYNERYYNYYQTGIIKTNNWREIIYQMAKDYYDNHKKVNYWQIINEYNNNRYLNRITTYEPFYTDLLGFWRQLYYDPIYEPLDYELPDGYTLEDYGYYDDEESSFNNYGGWNKTVYENPSALNFWFDFITPSGDLNKFSIDNIGVKGKYLNDSKIKSIAYEKPPAIKILSSMDWELLGDNPDPSYSYIQLGGLLENAYSVSTQGISALDKTQELLFNHTYIQESMNISIIPNDNININTRVQIEGFEDEYTVSKITMPLQYNGAMTLSLIKIPPTLTTETIRKEFE